jgi:hypothetical protein
MGTDGRRAIQCAPPDDGTFLQEVSQAYGEASHGVTGEMPLLARTLVLIRRQYPATVITLLPRPARGDSSGVVWLVAREGWAAAPHPTKSRPQNGSARTEQAGQPPGRYFAATTSNSERTHRAAAPAPAWERDR